MHAFASVSLVVAGLAALGTGGSEPMPGNTHVQHAAQPEPVRRLGIADGWFGSWEGDIVAIAPGVEPQRFTMRLDIERTPDNPAQAVWRITYSGFPVQVGRPPEQVRDYRLIAKDAAKSAYVIDEGNGISLAATLFVVPGAGERLISVFEVEEAFVTSAYTLAPDASSLVFDLVWSRNTDAQRTGGDNGAPVVTSYRVGNTQRAMLTRIE